MRMVSLLVAATAFFGNSLFSQAPNTPATFPSGKECAAKMTVPPGFVVKCFASEPDVVNPIGIDFDHRGRVFVLECLEYPRKAKGPKGRDRIRIYEDTDGDGVADKVTLFADGLNLATGLAVGHGGVFVGEAPNLIFLEDTDGDERADKRTVLLDGWGYQDTHETLNSFIWGPDGWLYGCHGVFTHSRVGKPGTPDSARVPLNAGIWRYHPKTRQFEVFAEGTSNPWGFDFDEHGSGFLTACVIPHLFHMVPGGLYRRQAGQNFNPYAYGEIKEICDHLHYFGASPHAGNKDARSLDRGGGHAHSGCLIYQGGAYPPEWHGRLFMNNIHGSRINTDTLQRNGSTYVGRHGPDFLVANDPNCRIIQLRTGPDGSVYMIDWYDPQICHNTNAAIWDRSHGRIYKVEYQGTPQPKVRDLAQRSNEELVELLKSKNSWWWRKALLLFQERGDKAAAPQLWAMVEEDKDPLIRLRALWALIHLNDIHQLNLPRLLKHPDAAIRAWAVRLVGQRFVGEGLHATLVDELVRLAKTDPSPDVRLQLVYACRQQRNHLSDARALSLLQPLMRRVEDAKDPVIPLLLWVAYEPYVLRSTSEALTCLMALPDQSALIHQHLLPRAMRRLAATGEAGHLEIALTFLAHQKHSAAVAAGMDGLLEALRGRRLTAPPAWAGLVKHAQGLENAPGVMQRIHRLGVHFGDQSTVAIMEKLALDPHAALLARTEAIQAMALARLPGSVAPLLRLVAAETPAEVQREVFRALAAFDSEAIPTALLARWVKLPAALRTEAVGLLTSRRDWAAQLLDAMERKTLTRQELSENDARRMLAFGDAALTKRVEQVWGKLREQTPQQVEQHLAKFRKQFAEQTGDRTAGHAVFEKNCMVCHKLFGKGHEVGPDLTGANRRDLDYLLVNILDPNRVVGRDYYSALVFDKSGRVHTGLLAEDTPQRVVLKGENAKLTVIPRSEIEEFKLEEKSLMPEGLPEKMSEKEFRDLIAYLQEDPFLLQGQVAGPFKMGLDSTSPIEKLPHSPLQVLGVRWKPFQVGLTGHIDMERLGVLAPPTDSTAFLYFEVKAPRKLTTTLEVAADEDVKVWLNGKEVLRRPRAQQGDRVALELNEGINRLLFKVHNVYGPSWLRARIADPDRILQTVPPFSP